MATAEEHRMDAAGDRNRKMEASCEGQAGQDSWSPPKKNNLLYLVDENPPWYLTIFFGFQHFLTMIGGTIATPLIVCRFLCMEESDLGRGHLVSTIMFVSGIITILQTTLGVRLPIIQGGNFAYLVPTITLLTTTFPPCDTIPLANMTAEEKQEVWQVRLRELQGAITVSAIFQVLVGFTGVVGMLLTWITPLAIVPTITLLGLSLYELGAKQASVHWGIAALTMVLMILFSQYLRDLQFPIPLCKAGGGFQVSRLPLFTFLPLLITICISWSLCAILTAYDAIPEGSTARTDFAGSLIQDAPWFRVPYPGQWGMPTVSVAGVVGVMAGVISSIVESIGDYFACARVANVPPPPTHALNRGVGVEGIGCVLAGIFGTSSGTASYSGNIALVGITKVGSRSVVLCSGLMMLLFGVFGKFGAVFATLPEPVLGGVLIFVFSVVTAIGLSTLQYVDLASSRNLLILGFSIFMGMALPNWLQKHPDAIQTGSIMLDQSLTVLLQTSMFVGGFIGFFLDNTVPGTDEERGLVSWHENLRQADSSAISGTTSIYDLPYITASLRSLKWARYVPFFPTFKGFRKRASAKNAERGNIPL
ncbi:solute carrier family 23 member 2 [Penaeus vannamei]